MFNKSKYTGPQPVEQNSKLLGKFAYSLIFFQMANLEYVKWNGPLESKIPQFNATWHIVGWFVPGS